MEWRCPHLTRWNRRYPTILSEILPKFEMQQDLSSVEEELHRLSVNMRDFKVRPGPPTITRFMIAALNSLGLTLDSSECLGFQAIF